MKNCAELALLVLILMHKCDDTMGEAGIDNAELPEDETLLQASSIAVVVNPEDIDPPTFGVAIFNNDVLLGAGAIIAKYFVLTLCSLVKSVEYVKQFNIHLSEISIKLKLEAHLCTSVIFAHLLPFSNEIFYSIKHLKIRYPVFSGEEMDFKNITINAIKSTPDCSKEDITPSADLSVLKTHEAMEETGTLKYPKLPSVHIPEDKRQFFLSSLRVENKIAINIKEAVWYIITKKINNELCEILFARDHELFSPEGNLCFSYYHLGDGGFCKEDVGSPLSIRYKHEYTIVGLNLHKHNCGHPKEAAAFVCLKSNKEWIEKTMSEM